jgi:hypothetical protein
MPNKVIKSFAKKTNKSIEEIEAKWAKAKSIVSDEVSENDPSYYARVVAILKKMIGLSENCTHVEKFRKFL